MKLVYLWIDGYKNINNFEILFNNEYENYSLYDAKTNFLNIDITKKEKTELNIFEDANLNITAIVGLNGSGKTNILDMLFNILKNNCRQDHKYFLLIEINGQFYYKKSILPHINKKKGLQKMDNKQENELYKNLMFKPFLKEDPFRKNNNYYTKYDTQAQFEEKIQKGFYYDRFDEKETTFIIGKKYDDLKSLDLIQNNTQLQFDNFSWEIDVYSCYEYLTRRLNNSFSLHKKDEEENYNFVFPSVGSIEKKLNDRFYNLVNKISSYKRKKSFKRDMTYLKNEIFPDIIFFSAILEFTTFIYVIDASAKDKHKMNLTDTDEIKQNKLDKWHEPLNEIFEIFLSNIKRNISEVTPISFIKELILILENKTLNYNKYCNENTALDFIKNLNKYIYNIENPENYLNIFSHYFEEKKNTDILMLKNEYSIKMEDFLSTNINDYQHNFVCAKLNEIFSYRFLYQFFYVNFYGKEGKYTFKDLSSGEQRILKFFADINYCNTRDIYLFDEMDLCWHPEWQRLMIYYLVDYFKKNNNDKFVNILITTHSPFIVSDLPKENIIFLKRDKEGNAKIVPAPMQNSFGMNIHALFKEGFFLDSTIGEFAKNKIEKLIEDLKSEKNIEKKKEFLPLINIIGEPLIKNELIKMVYAGNEALITENEELKLKIKKLEEKLKND